VAPDRLTGAVLPMAVWALHFVAIYSLSGLACGQGWLRTQHGGLETVSLLQMAVTLAAWSWLSWWGWRSWRCGRVLQAGDGGDDGRGRFLARLSLSLSAIAALAVLFTALPLPMLPPCAP